MCCYVKCPVYLYMSPSELPEWICDLTDTGEWLHTGSKKSTPATAQTETLDRSEKSARQRKMCLLLF